jgi:non-specific serine/threonine protein kinase
MLETIREYAAERLEESDQAERTRRRHARFFLSLAETADLVGEVPTAAQLDLVRGDTDNLRAALGWSLASDPELGLRLCVALEGFWPVVNAIEGMRWYRALLERAPDAPLELRAHALRALGGSANPAGRDDVAEHAYAESLTAFRALGDDARAAQLVARLGYAAFYRGDSQRARSLAEESLQAFRVAGDRHGESISLGLLGEVRFSEGDAVGLELMAESAGLAGEAGFGWWRAGMLGKLSDCWFEQGRAETAETYAREALSLSYDFGDRLRIVRGLARLARVAAGDGRQERAGRLWGAVEAEELLGAIGAWENERERYERAVLSHAGSALELGRAQGRRLPLDEAVAAALSID